MVRSRFHLVLWPPPVLFNVVVDVLRGFREACEHLVDGYCVDVGLNLVQSVSPAQGVLVLCLVEGVHLLRDALVLRQHAHGLALPVGKVGHLHGGGFHLGLDRRNNLLPQNLLVLSNIHHYGVLCAFYYALLHLRELSPEVDVVFPNLIASQIVLPVIPVKLLFRHSRGRLERNLLLLNVP